MSLAYVGGKFRQSKVWAPKILELTTDRHSYVEPFLGGASVFEKLAPHFEDVWAGDTNEDLIAMWSDVRDGQARDYREDVTAEVHAQLKNSTEHFGYRAFVGFGCSFAGMWFAKFNPGGPKTKRAILKNAAAYEGVNLCHGSYEQMDKVVEKGTVVYCDPPYAGTIKFKGGQQFPFDYDKFWATMREWRSRGAHVFVSEYKAPEDWTCVSELDLAKTVSSTKNGARQLDKLFR